MDQPRRKQTYSQIQRIIKEEAPSIFLFHQYDTLGDLEEGGVRGPRRRVALALRRPAQAVVRGSIPGVTRVGDGREGPARPSPRAAARRLRRRLARDVLHPARQRRPGLPHDAGGAGGRPGRSAPTMGFNDPLPIQFGRFVGNTVRGDFGQLLLSPRRRRCELVIERMPTTILLTLLALAAGGGWWRCPSASTARSAATRMVDHVATVVVFLGQSMPAFWTGHHADAALRRAMAGPARVGLGDWAAMILPAVTLGTFPAPLLLRIVRSSMLEVLSLDYVRTARAKGVSEWLVICRHALKNAALPLVTVTGLQFGILLGGAVITESVFADPRRRPAHRAAPSASSTSRWSRPAVFMLAMIVVVRELRGRPAVRLPESPDPDSLSGLATLPSADPPSKPRTQRRPRAARASWRKLVRNPAALVGGAHPARRRRRGDRRPLDRAARPGQAEPDPALHAAGVGAGRQPALPARHRSGRARHPEPHRSTARASRSRRRGRRAS